MDNTVWHKSASHSCSNKERQIGSLSTSLTTPTSLHRSQGGADRHRTPAKATQVTQNILLQTGSDGIVCVCVCVCVCAWYLPIGLSVCLWCVCVRVCDSALMHNTLELRKTSSLCVFASEPAWSLLESFLTEKGQ